MTIRREFRKLYGARHRAHRDKLIALFGPRCMNCKRKIEKYLNAAHSTHNPVLPADRLWCPRCHALHDAKHAKAIARRTRAASTGQNWLTNEIEHAVDPAPRPPAAEQEKLF